MLKYFLTLQQQKNSMNPHSKNILKNANGILNKIKLKYLRIQQDDTQLLAQNKTFMEEDSLELDEHHNQNKSPNREDNSLKKGRAMDELSQIVLVQKEVPSFCQRLVYQKLEESIKVYEDDLEVLQENRSCLEEQIELMVQKIKKTRELEQINKILSAQNEEIQQELLLLMQKHQKSQHILFKAKLKEQQSFNSIRNKVRIAIKQLGEDYHYIGFVESWNRHTEQLINDRRTIKEKIRNEVKGNNLERQQEKLEKLVIPVQTEQLGRQEDQFLAPDEPKPKKKLTPSQKAALLGDLKSFAKNFKLPPT